jgi:predicted RNA-binding protein
MCQVSVVLEQDGSQTKIMENVTLLEMVPEGVSVSTLFEEPKIVTGVRLKKIDFLGGSVVLTSEADGER